MVKLSLTLLMLKVGIINVEWSLTKLVMLFVRGVWVWERSHSYEVRVVSGYNISIFCCLFGVLFMKLLHNELPSPPDDPPPPDVGQPVCSIGLLPHLLFPLYPCPAFGSQSVTFPESGHSAQETS